MLYYYDDIVAEYGKMFADDAARTITKMRLYSEYLNLENFYGKTPEEFIRIFSNYGRMLYSRETYLWMLAYLLSGKYSFVKDGWYSREIKSRVDGYCISLTIDEEVYIGNYLRLSKLQEGESINRFFELDEKLVAIPITSIRNKFLKHLRPDKLYSVSEDLFLLYVIEEEIYYTHDDDWAEFVKRLKYSHQKENFNLSAMLTAVALCSDYDWHMLHWKSWNKDDVLCMYRHLKSKSKKNRQLLANLFLVYRSDFGRWMLPLKWKRVQ